MRRDLCAFLALLFLCGMVAACAGPAAAPSDSPSAETVPAAGTTAESAQNSGSADGFTAYADYTPATSVPVPLQSGTDSNILVAYFSRADNTEIPLDAGPDALTSASLMVDAEGNVPDSAKEMALFIAEDTGGDLYAIQTEYTYPLDYDETVAVGEGQDIDGYLPAIAGSEVNLDLYDTVFLVYPIWHFSLPAPVRSFLSEHPMPGKTICAFATNEGSQFGNSLDVIAETEPDATVVAGLSVRAGSVDESRDEIRDAVRNLLGNNSNDMTDEAQEGGAMLLTIGDSTFSVRPADSSAAREFAAMLAENPVTIEMSDYSGFEKVGSLGRSLTASNERITTKPGDIMLYNGSNIVLFYGQNTWDYTPIGAVDDLSGWEAALGSGGITATFSLGN